jgi:two-component system, LytTR family, response regulator
MNAIIVDDEKNGVKVLKTLIKNYCPEIEVIANADNIEDAFKIIQSLQPDLVFLDIEMPNGNGFELLKKFDQINFQIIFTTAFDGYAIKAIKYHAIDYLLKPIDIDELKLAVESATKNQKEKPKENKYLKFVQEQKLQIANKIAVPVKDGMLFIAINDIVRIESDGSYSTFHMCDLNKIVASKNLKEYEDILPINEFFRTHKSHLINLKYVKKYFRGNGHFVEMNDGSKVEIARRKKDEFFKLMVE